MFNYMAEQDTKSTAWYMVDAKVKQISIGGVCVCVYHVRRVGCKDLSPIACLMICTTFRLDLPCHAFGLAVGCKQGSKCKQWSLVPKATWWMVVASYFSEWLSGGGRVKVWGFIEPLGRVIAQWQLQPGGVGKTGLTL